MPWFGTALVAETARADFVGVRVAMVGTALVAATARVDCVEVRRVLVDIRVCVGDRTPDSRSYSDLVDSWADVGLTRIRYAPRLQPS